MPLTRARLKISDYSDRRKANVRRTERRIRMVSLSLTSMVDMFAILVIFLLTNQDSVNHWIDVGHGIRLPQSRHSTPPPRALSVQIAQDGIYAERKLLSIEESLKAQGEIPSLKEWLQQHGNRHSDYLKGHVNIVGHEKVAFGAIRRVVQSAQAAGFTHVNLAVQPKD